MFRGRTPVVPNWKTRATRTTRRPLRRKTPSTAACLISFARSKRPARCDLGADRARLDPKYLDGVRSIEKAHRLHRSTRQKLEAARCGEPRTFQIPRSFEFTEGKHIDLANHESGSPVIRRYHENYTKKLMIDLLVLAFQTDQRGSGCWRSAVMKPQFPGVVTVGYETHCHTLEHQGNAGRIEDADPISRESLAGKFTSGTHSYLPEWSSRCGPSTKAAARYSTTRSCFTRRTWPTVGTAHTTTRRCWQGKAGSTLKPGRHIAYKSRTPVSNLYAEILDRMGA